MPAVSDRTNRRFIIAVVAVVFAIGGWLRLTYYGTTHGQSDEQITVEVLRHMRHSGDWDVNWAKADLPPDLRYDQYNFSSHLYATFFFYRFVKLLPGLEYWRSVQDGFLVYRFFAAALATIAVVQTFQLGRRLGGIDVGLGAALLAAVAPLLVQDAHYVRPESFTTALTLAAVACAWPREEFVVRRAITSAFLVGLLVACKVSMLLLGWVPFVAWLAAGRLSWRQAWIPGSMFFALLAGFAVGAPGAWLHPQTFVHGVLQLTSQYAGLHPPHGHLAAVATGDLMLRYFATTLGWPMLACFGFGVAALLRKKLFAEAAIVAGPALAFAGFFASRTVFFERNLSHVVPLVAIVAAFGARELASWLARSRMELAPWLMAAALILCAALPGVISSRLVWLAFSDRGAQRLDHSEAELRARYPNAEWQTLLLLTDDMFEPLIERFRSNRTPVLLRVDDYRDEWTARTLPHFRQRFAATEVRVDEGLFPGVAMSTLLTYHSPTYRYFLISGLRSR